MQTGEQQLKNGDNSLERDFGEESKGLYELDSPDNMQSSPGENNAQLVHLMNQQSPGDAG